MKKLLLLSIFTIFSLASFAQEKATLTKEETVNYLTRKLKEIDGQYADSHPFSGTNKHYFWAENQKFYMKNESVFIEYEYCNCKKDVGTKVDENRDDGNGSYVYQTVTTYPCNYRSELSTYKFNPAHIIDIVKYGGSSSTAPIRYLKIVLKSSTATQKVITTSPKSTFWLCPWCEKDERNTMYCYNLTPSVSDNGALQMIYLPFLNADDSEFNKIKKALEHLRDLYKAEDDPFGN